MRRRPKPPPRPATYWRPWFAWHPVTLENSGERVWLGWIWRHQHREPGHLIGDWYTVTRYRDDVHWGAANLPFDQSSGHQSVKA